MATADEIARFRLITDLPENVEPWTDTYISNIIDQLGFETAASTAWRVKAASVASLVDTTESGSTRRLSQLHKQFLDMGSAIDPPVDTAGISFTVPIERV